MEKTEFPFFEIPVFRFCCKIRHFFRDQENCKSLQSILPNVRTLETQDKKLLFCITGCEGRENWTGEVEDPDPEGAIPGGGGRRAENQAQTQRRRGRHKKVRETPRPTSWKSRPIHTAHQRWRDVAVTQAQGTVANVFHG